MNIKQMISLKLEIPKKKLGLAFYPDTNETSKKVNYNAVKNKIITVKSLQEEQVEKHPSYLYKEIDNKSGELIKIKKNG